MEMQQFFYVRVIILQGVKQEHAESGGNDIILQFPDKKKYAVQ